MTKRLKCLCFECWFIWLQNIESKQNNTKKLMENVYRKYIKMNPTQCQTQIHSTICNGFSMALSKRFESTLINNYLTNWNCTKHSNRVDQRKTTFKISKNGFFCCFFFIVFCRFFLFRFDYVILSLFGHICVRVQTCHWSIWRGFEQRIVVTLWFWRISWLSGT